MISTKGANVLGLVRFTYQFINYPHMIQVHGRI